MPFSIHTMAWSGEHRTFVVEELIQNGGSPIMTSMPFTSASCSVDMIPFLIKNNSQFGVELNTNWFCIKKEIYWPTLDCNRTGNCGRCESFD
jgi:hypothetical protein